VHLSDQLERAARWCQGVTEDCEHFLSDSGTVMRWIRRLSPAVVSFLALSATQALARVGGGENFDSGNSSSDSDVAIDGFIVDILWWLIVKEPQVGIPLTITIFIAVVVWNKLNDGDVSTRKAIDRAEAKQRTQVSPAALDGWVNALKARDPKFDPGYFLERTRREFLELQEAWFRRDLEPVRRYLSDATFQRLTTQLRLMNLVGVRDAVADPEVFDLQIIRLEQNEAFDTVHVRISARIHDDEAPATASDSEARVLARRKWPERFTEVWTFVRKPGAQTKPDSDVSQGKCPSCGAPFAGGAANTCEFCGAIVNSGTYDWVLAEITQGSQYQSRSKEPKGFAQQRKSDPGLTTQVLEDRASLLFWKWVEAQSMGDAARLAKVASPSFIDKLKAGLDQLGEQGKQKYFIECAAGAVDTQQFSQTDGRNVAAVEIRWSARIAVGAKNGRPPSVPSQPQRHVLLLERRSGAQTGASGMSTSRCPSCAAPLSDNGQPTCEFCGTVLSAGEADWVLRDFGSWEWWRTQGETSVVSRAGSIAQDVPGREERERLIYLMVTMAKADGEVDKKERCLLQMASGRWGIPWENVELALNAAGDALASNPVAKGSAEAESFLRDVVQLMLADGKVDAKEKKLLKMLAAHLGLLGRLSEFLK